MTCSGCAYIKGTGFQVAFRDAELVLDLCQAMILFDHFLCIHGQFRGDDLVIAQALFIFRHLVKASLVVYEQPHLDNGKLALFLADAHLAQSSFYDISFFIQDILIRRSDLEIEVCYIIIDDLRGAACLFYKVCVDAADDFVFIGKKGSPGCRKHCPGYGVQGQAHSNLHSGRIVADLEAGFKSLPKKEELCEAVDIVLQL